MARVCRQCGIKLNRYHKGNLCYPCQEKRLGEVIPDDEDLIDAEGFAHILSIVLACMNEHRLNLRYFVACL